MESNNFRTFGGEGMKPEIIDNINKPNHYIGTYGLEVKDVTRNFIKGKAEMEAHHWCSAVEYLL